MRIFKGNKFKKGFTIIELLTVVAVIGLLSSIALVSYTGTTQKARVARGHSFSTSIQNALGIELVGAWNFDEGAGGTTRDLSGSNSDGILTGHSPTWVTTSNSCIKDNCLDFNSALSNYVEVPTSEPLNFSDNFTVEIWAKSDLDGAYSLISKGAYFAIYQGWHISTASSPANLLFEVSDGISRSYINFYTGRSFNWTHIVATRSGNRITAYANGSVRSQGTTAIGSVSNSINVFLGRRASAAGLYFDGQIDSTRIYAQALTLGQIRARYLAGLENLFAKGLITNEEYKNRVSDIQTEYAFDYQ